MTTVTISGHADEGRGRADPCGDRGRRADGAAPSTASAGRVGVAPPAPGAGRRGVPRGRDRCRGDGESWRLVPVEAYRMLAHVGETSLSCARSAPRPRRVGHDWGSRSRQRPRRYGRTVRRRGAARRAVHAARRRAAAVSRATSTSATSRRQAWPRPRSKSDVRGWLRRFYAALTDGDARVVRRPDAAPRRAAAGMGRRLRRDHRELRAQRLRRAAEPLPQLHPRLGGPRRLRRAPPARDLHHRRTRQHATVARRRDRAPTNGCPASPAPTSSPTAATGPSRAPRRKSTRSCSTSSTAWLSGNAHRRLGPRKLKRSPVSAAPGATAAVR